MSEEKIRVNALKKGDHQAIEEVVFLYGQRLLRAAFLLCGNISDAPDIAQETFLRAIKSVHRFKGKSSLYTWLYGILLNVCRQFYRKKRHIQMDDLERYASPDEHSAEQEYELRDEYSNVVKHMHTLSQNHREVLILRYYEELKIRDIAEITKVSRGTVKSRLHYATSALRKKIPEDLNLLSNSKHLKEEKQ